MKADHEVDAILRHARLASGGTAWNEIATATLSGIYEAGGAQGQFRQVIELRARRWRMDIQIGPLANSDGDDGRPWTSKSGIVTSIDLPGLLKDARGRAFLQTEGWRSGKFRGRLAKEECDLAIAACVVFDIPGGSPATVWFSRQTGLPMKTVLETDDGAETTALEDWRDIGGSRLSFKRRISDATGASVTLSVREAHLSRRAVGSAARPRARPHGTVPSGGTTVSFRFTGIDRGHIVVPATVNGRVVEIMFDSGGANYLTAEAARALGIKPGGGINVTGVGEASQQAGLAEIPEISIGSARLADQVAIVGPLPYAAVHPRSGMSVAGLMGYELLSEFRTTIDYAARTLTLSDFASPRPVGTSIPFLSDGHSIYVQAEVEGVKGLFRLDTGDNGALTVFRRFADARGILTSVGADAVQAGGVGGTVQTRNLTSRSFRLAGLELSGVTTSVTDAKAGAFFSRTLAGNIGSGILSRFRITFDFRARTLTFSPLPNAGSPFERERTGLSLNQTTPQSITVLSVAAGSAAEEAGVLAGDEVIAVDGRPVASGIGIFDLVPQRFGSKTFTFKLRRSGTERTVSISPK